MEPNASSASVDAEQNLDHIYFFLERSTRIRRTHALSDSSDGTTIVSTPKKTRDSSRDSTGTGSSATITGSATSSTSSSLNPGAASFFSPSRPSKAPRSLLHPSPPEQQLYEIRQVPGKGLGLIAIDFVPRGTRIISEEPLLRVPKNSVPLAWVAYSQLDSARKGAFDALHSYHVDADGFENTSRLSLIDYSDRKLEDEEALDALVAEHVRVMCTFSVNCFNLVPEGLAVYTTASRLNHSCAPNCFHGYNPNIERFTVHAARDIMAGEELTVNYIGSPADFMVRSQRLEMMRTGYGFTCTCSSCADYSNEGPSQSDRRRELLTGICWGLEQYEQGAQASHQLIPDGPARALYNAQYLIRTLNDEGLQTFELKEAVRAASRYALDLQDWRLALGHAKGELEIERNILGLEVQDLRARGEAAGCWIDHVRGVIWQTLRAEDAGRLFEEYFGADEEVTRAIYEKNGRVAKPVKTRRGGKKKGKQARAKRAAAEKLAAEKTEAEEQNAEGQNAEGESRKKSARGKWKGKGKWGERSDDADADGGKGLKDAEQIKKCEEGNGRKPHQGPSTWAQVVAAGAGSSGPDKEE